MLANPLGIDSLSVQVTLNGLTATARRDGELVSITREIAPPGINAQRISALERLAGSSRSGLTPQPACRRARRHRGRPAAPLDTDGRRSRSAWPPAPSPTSTAATCWARRWPSPPAPPARRCAPCCFAAHRNQYAVTALCAVVTAGLYCGLIVEPRRRRLRAGPCGGLHLLGAVPGARLPTGRGLARPRPAPARGRSQPALLCRHDPARRGLRPFRRRRPRRSRRHAAGGAVLYRRCHDAGVARAGEPARRFRLRRALQQLAAHRAGRRRPVAGRQRPAAGAARSSAWRSRPRLSAARSRSGCWPRWRGPPGGAAHRADGAQHHHHDARSSMPFRPSSC